MTASARPLLQAHIDGRTVTLMLPNGGREQHAAGGKQDPRAVAVQQALSLALSLGSDVEMLTSGDHGDHHLLIAVDGRISPVELEPIVVAQEPAYEAASAGGGAKVTREGLSPALEIFTTSVHDNLDADTVLRRQPDAGSVFDDDGETVLVARGPHAVLTFDDGTVLTARGPLTIGRRPVRPSRTGTIIPIDDPSGTISRRHLFVDLADGCCWVTDLGSANGTALIRGDSTVDLLPHQRMPLVDGDRLLLGDREAIVTLEGLAG